jgi:hypothetical protein
MQEKYYYGQGKVFSRPYGSGSAWRWWGDVSKLSYGGQSEKVKHKESFSGSKSTTRNFTIGKEMTVNATLHQLDGNALAENLWGLASDIASGSVTGEVLPNPLVAGDIIKLDYPGVSSLVLTDSAGTPATYGAGNYSHDGRFGSIEIITPPSGLTYPIKAAYSHAAGKRVNFLSQPQPILEFKYEGLNLAEGNAPVIFHFYKMATETLKELALITDGNDVAGVEISAEVLLDSSKPYDGVLGQFGQFIQVG